MDNLYEYASKKFSFDTNRWPIFQKEYSLEEWPEDIVTFDLKREVVNLLLKRKIW